MFANLWRYRSFIFGMVKREFLARYLGSLLGTLWAVISPLAMIFIYTIIFGRVMKAKLVGVDDSMAYGVFLCAGVLTWGTFTEVINRCVTVFIEQANLLKKMSFPRATLPAVVLLSSSVNFAIIFAVLCLFLIVSGRFPGWPLLGFFPILLLQQSFALGLGVCLGVVNVFFRDVGHAIAIVLQFWFWLTPIVYPASILPENVRWMIELNPITRMVISYQDILLHARWPRWQEFGLHAIGAVLALGLGVVAFRRLSGEMVDYL
ncbi:MAG TPA: ABC transporter permease [Candidatus Bathyarchaeia archaeon]|nr:ABC transporter permease [Candidatus Bathyarchaeia archaeon]